MEKPSDEIAEDRDGNNSGRTSWVAEAESSPSACADVEVAPTSGGDATYRIE